MFFAPFEGDEDEEFESPESSEESSEDSSYPDADSESDWNPESDGDLEHWRADTIEYDIERDRFTKLRSAFVSLLTAALVCSFLDSDCP